MLCLYFLGGHSLMQWKIFFFSPTVRITPASKRQMNLKTWTTLCNSTGFVMVHVLWDPPKAQVQNLQPIMHPPPASLIWGEAKILHNQGIDAAPALNRINAKPKTWKMMESWNMLARNMKQYRCILLNQFCVNSYSGRKTASLLGALLWWILLFLEIWFVWNYTCLASVWNLFWEAKWSQQETKWNKYWAGFLFLHTNNPEMKSKQMFPHLDEKWSMHAMLIFFFFSFNTGTSAAMHNKSKAHPSLSQKSIFAIKQKSISWSTWTLDSKNRTKVT